MRCLLTLSLLILLLIVLLIARYHVAVWFINSVTG